MLAPALSVELDVSGAINDFSTFQSNFYFSKERTVFHVVGFHE